MDQYRCEKKVENVCYPVTRVFCLDQGTGSWLVRRREGWREEKTPTRADTWSEITSKQTGASLNKVCSQPNEKK